MDLGIAGKRALVLSASGGLGSAMALALANEGVTVCLAGRNEDALNDVAEKVRARQGTAYVFTWDLSDEAQWRAGVEDVLQQVAGIDILINNTGGPQPGPAFGHETDAWRGAFESMIIPVIGITDMLLPGMRERGWGRVITSTSSGVITPITNLGLSNATRTSLLGWSKTLARDVAAQGITSNIIVPGRIATARTRFLDAARAKREGSTLEAVERASMATIPVGRYGRPEEYGDAVAYLASAQAAYITGAILRVDGGLINSI